jgi:sterol desaturase/sphingolipid hydroxylase (fatty acid hydroxylase superfamily)
MTEVFVVWIVALAFDAGRYLLVAVPAFLLVWHWGRERYRARLIQRDHATREHLVRELRYSATTALVFSVVGTALWFGARAGLFRLYDDPLARGEAYFAFTLVLLTVLHDAYFYWTHRAMHHRRLFKRVHAAHHLSTNPSPLAAYAFAPAEAVIQALYVPLIALVVPLSQLALFLFLAFMIVRNVLGHLGVELHPRWFVRNRWTAVLTTTTHHAMHHRKPAGNYGLYFTFWDRLMGTTHADYEAVFDEVTGRTAAHSERRDRTVRR